MHAPYRFSVPSAGLLFEVGPTGDAFLASTLTTGRPTCSGGCDAVFSGGYALPRIAEHTARTFALGRVLNELEHAHSDIARQEDRIADLSQGEVQARTQLAAQSDRLARLEALVAALTAERRD